jgi:hypothetical protein
MLRVLQAEQSKKTADVASIDFADTPWTIVITQQIAV